MKEDKAVSDAEKQADFLLSQQKTEKPHKHHMAALTISFVVLALIIGFSIIYLNNSAS